MAKRKTAAALKGRVAEGLDPRIAALARLLARHAARKECEREQQKELSASQAAGYDSDSLSGDES